MKLTRLICAGAAMAALLTGAASLAACDTVPLGGGGGVLSQTAVDEKAMYGLEAAYNVAATAYVVAETNGYLTPERKAALKPKLIAAYQALLKARAAYKAVDLAGFNAASADLKTNADAVTSALPPVPQPPT